MRHLCPVRRCTTEIEREKAFCFDHWRKLPKLLQLRVNKAWRALKEHRTLENINAHRAALDEATHAIEEGRRIG